MLTESGIEFEFGGGDDVVPWGTTVMDCTNPQACNFNEMANADDGSCDFACWPTAVEEG